MAVCVTYNALYIIEHSKHRKVYTILNYKYSNIFFT